MNEENKCLEGLVRNNLGKKYIKNLSEYITTEWKKTQNFRNRIAYLALLIGLLTVGWNLGGLVINKVEAQKSQILAKEYRLQKAELRADMCFNGCWAKNTGRAY